MIGSVSVLYAFKAESFEDKLSSGILTFTAIIMFVVLPLGIVLYLKNPEKFTIGFDYGKHFGKANSRGITSERLARLILRYSDISDVAVEKKTAAAARFRRDHNYDSAEKKITLAQDVYGDDTMYAICAAVHECGHAIQHSENYLPVKLFNNSRVKIAAAVLLGLIFICTFLSIPFGFSFSWIFTILFVIVFAGMTCPEKINARYERDANKRAVKVLEDHAIFGDDELEVIRKMLKKAPHDPFKYARGSKG